MVSFSYKEAQVLHGILRNRLEMASHNLMCYSKNVLMTVPKEKFESEWLRASVEVEEIINLINILEHQL